MATLGASAKASARVIIGEAFTSDYIVSEKLQSGFGLPTEVADAVAGLLGGVMAPLSGFSGLAPALWAQGQAVPAEPDPSNPSIQPGVYDVKSGSELSAMDGSRYSDW